MYSCMKESNHHKLEKNQNRHHFGQLPWSLKNPDGTHLAWGRGWDRKEALERKYPSWNTREEGKDKQSEQQSASGQGCTARTFLQRSHMASQQTPGAAGLAILLHHNTLQLHILLCSPSKTDILLAVTEKITLNSEKQEARDFGQLNSFH